MTGVRGGRAVIAGLVAGVAMLVAAAPAGATRMLAVTNTSPPHDLISFESAAPGAILSDLPITGLAAGDAIIGLDLRPADGVLYVLTMNGTVDRLYQLNPNTAVASVPVTLAADPADTTTPFTSIAGPGIGSSFDPTTDRLRIVDSGQQNLRVDADTGLVTTDASINPVASLDAAAFTNNFQHPSISLEFVYDFSLDRLKTIPGPQTGTLSDVGSSGLVTSSIGRAGLDVTSTGGAFMNAVVGASDNFYSANLSTGAMTLIGAIGTGSTPIVDIGSLLENEIRLAQPTATVAESGGTADLTLTRENPRLATVVHFATADGTATAGSDYTPVADGTVTFAPGEIAKTISVPIIDDTADEPAETFKVSVTGASTFAGTAAVLAPSSATVTIKDDDPPAITNQTFFKSGVETLNGTDVKPKTKLVPKADGSLALLNLDCRSTSVCSSSYKLYLGRAPASKRKPVIGARGKAKIPAGDSRSRILKLSGKGLKKLRKLGKVRSTLVVASSDRSGHARTDAKSLKLAAG